MAKSKITLYDSINFNCLNRAGIRSPANTDNFFQDEEHKKSPTFRGTNTKHYQPKNSKLQTSEQPPNIPLTIIINALKKQKTF